MYGKIFHSIYDGTLAEDWRALITFQQLIILCDADGIIDMTPQSISRRTGIPIEYIEIGLSILIKSDPHSRSEGEEGKRIIPLNPDRNWGWKIVNHKHYRDLRTSDDRREYMRKYMKEKRSKQKLTKANKSKQLTELANTDTDTDTDTIKPLSAKNTFSTGDYDIAIRIHKKIKELNPNTKDPHLDKWANEIRLMRERDKRSHEEIIKIFTWANNDPFWRTNILSPVKLRKQFDQLTIKSNGENNATHQKTNKLSLGERATAAREEYERQNDN